MTKENKSDIKKRILKLKKELAILGKSDNKARKALKKQETENTASKFYL